MDAKSFASLLLDLGCVKVSPLNPYTYASGLVGPIYCDNRKILSHVAERRQIIAGFQALCLNHKLDFDVVAGVATAGIPHAALLSEITEKPMIYVRSKAKEHGKQNQIEGDFKLGQKVLVLEDLVNQGKSVVEAILALNNSGLNVVASMSIVDYQMKKAVDLLNSLQLKNYALTSFSSLVTVALEKKLITLEEKKLLLDWQSDPVLWSETFH